MMINMITKVRTTIAITKKKNSNNGNDRAT